MYVDESGMPLEHRLVFCIFEEDISLGMEQDGSNVPVKNGCM